MDFFCAILSLIHNCGLCGLSYELTRQQRLEMPRSKPVIKGGKYLAKTVSKTNEHVAKPYVSELPTSLKIHIEKVGIPSVITDAFPEFRNPQPFFSALERVDHEFGGSYDAYKTCWVGLPAESILSVEHARQRQGQQGEGGQ